LAISSSILRLSNKQIGDEEAKALSAGLAQNVPWLNTLALSRNRIGAEGAKALGAALALNSSLTSLDLCGN
jgi:hypothetical protein